MDRRILLPTAALCVALAAASGTPVEAQPSSSRGHGYMARAHSHNDYERPRPLLDALERGFASIEVDVVLADGELYVAHAPDELVQGATLTRLYLDPLRALVTGNGGSVYSLRGPSLQLLIDVKTDAEPTYAALDETLREYEDIFTTWTAGRRRDGAVTAVVSGNRALASILTEPLRRVSIDGRLDDDRSRVSTEEMPLVSLDWDSVEPTDVRVRLARVADIVGLLHGEGRKVRFWGAPDDEDLWASLLDAGVDYIGTDDAARLERLLRLR